MIELLLSADAAIDAVDNEGHTPISLASNMKFQQALDLFRAHEQRSKAVGVQSSQAFEAAKRGSVSTLEKLLDAGMDVNIHDYDDR